MQVLLQFLSRAYPLFFFLLLELVCLILMINNHHYQRVSYLHGANAVSGFIDEKLSGIGAYLHLNEANKDLLEQNKQLLNQLYNTPDTDFAATIAQEDADCEENKVSNNDFRQLYVVEAAKVVNRTVKRQHNYLTINKGRKHGIKEDMGVISVNGLVGIVKNVSENYATVMTLLHKQSRISALIKTTNNFGSLRWDGKNEKIAQLFDIPSYVNIPKGDTVVTSGFSSIFPKGIFVGTVIDTEKSQGDNFHIVNIDLASNFNRLTHVYIIEHTDKKERLELETETEKGLLK